MTIPNKPPAKIYRVRFSVDLVEQSIVELIESGSTQFSFRVGNKRLINRELFDEFIKEGCRIGFN